MHSYIHLPGETDAAAAVTVMETHIETLWVREHLGQAGFCCAYFCQKRQVALFSVQPPVNKAQVGIAFGNSFSLNKGAGRETRAGHTQRTAFCQLTFWTCSGLRAGFWVSGLWSTPLSSSLGWVTHHIFFCLKDDLVSKGQIVEFPKNN